MNAKPTHPNASPSFADGCAIEPTEAGIVRAFITETDSLPTTLNAAVETTKAFESLTVHGAIADPTEL